MSFQPVSTFQLVLVSGMLASANLLAAPSSQTFRLTEVDSKVLVQEGTASRQPKEDTQVKAGAVLETGVHSKLELTGDHGTVIRAGAGTKISLSEETGRLNLEKGSLLLSAPSGKTEVVELGGIQVNVKNASVVVGAAVDGSFKVLVLSGKAKIFLANGQVSSLGAGQMSVGKTNDSQLEPARYFRLGEQVGSSNLVNGFKTALPAAAQVKAAVNRQEQRLGIADKGAVAETDRKVAFARTLEQLEGYERAQAIVRNRGEQSPAPKAYGSTSFLGGSIIIRPTSILSGSTVILRNQTSLVAADPGNNKPVRNGMVNFIRNVFDGNTEIKFSTNGSNVNNADFHAYANQAGKNLNGITIGSLSAKTAK